MDRQTERNLIQRVNVGDMLTRSAARAPDDVGDRRWRAPLQLCRVQRARPTARRMR